MNQFTPALCLLAVMIPAGVVLLLACRRANQREAREHDAAAAKMRRWQAWRACEPNPESRRYQDWNNGGGALFVADRERYYREHPEPEL